MMIIQIMLIMIIRTIMIIVILKVGRAALIEACQAPRSADMGGACHYKPIYLSKS